MEGARLDGAEKKDEAPRKPGEEPPVKDKPPFFLQLGRPREVPGLPAFKRIAFSKSVPMEKIIFAESWLLTRVEEQMNPPLCMGDNAELLARSSSTGFNLELEVNAVTDDLFGKMQTVYGASVVSKFPWLKIEMSTASPSAVEFSYVPYFEHLRDATVSTEFMAAFSRLSNHLRSGDWL